MIDLFNKYSSEFSYKVAPTLFLEFHGGQEEVERQGKETGLQFCPLFFLIKSAKPFQLSYFRTILAGEIIQSNGGSDFVWSVDAEERNRLWKARHEVFYAALNSKPGYKVNA